MAAPLELIEAVYPGNPALDVAISRALLREVADGERSETLRLARCEEVVAFSVSDLRRPGFEAALKAAREVGFDATLRLAGGAAALYHRQTLALSWCSPESDERRGIRARFEKLSDWVARALRRLGVEAGVGEVPGAWCPGDYSVNARGRLKLAGLGQRLVRGAAYAGGVIVVGDSARARAALQPVYAELGYDYDPRTTGSIEDEVGEIRVEAVRDALLAELAPEWSLVSGEIRASTQERAALFEPSYRLA